MNVAINCGSKYGDIIASFKVSQSVTKTSVMKLVKVSN